MKKYYKLCLRSERNISYYICKEGFDTWFLSLNGIFENTNWSITKLDVESVEARINFDIEEITEKYLKLRGKHLTNV